jgi:D-alanyl-D-alanine carboxypeptidase (penicillin-binding protein 5/6)
MGLARPVPARYGRAGAKLAGDDVKMSAPRACRGIFLRRATALAVAGALAAASLGESAAQLPKKEDTFNLSAPYAILIDSESGSVLFEKNADQLMEPSSMAKLMTVEVVFQAIKEGRLKPEDEFIISEHAWRHGGAPSHGSTMYAPIHSKVSTINLLQGAIIQSGNDACIALAEGMAGSEARFAEVMTARARELGLSKSVFANPTGLPDPRTKVTARELAKLARHLIKTYPDYYHFFGEREFTWNRIRQTNRNPLLTSNIGADGLKTGFTKEAGYGIVASAMQNGLRLIAVTNGFKDQKARADETRKLLEWGFRGFESRPLFAEGQAIGDARLFGGARGRVPLVANGSVRLLVPRNSNERVLARVVYTGPVRAPIEKGQQIGELRVWRGENVVLEVPLQASESVGRGSLGQRAFDAVTELVINLFRAGVQKL